MSAWIDCNERLPPIDVNAPKYAQRIRVIAGNSRYVGELEFGANAYAKRSDLHWQTSSGSPSVWQPTHWMPLPTAPIIE